MMVHRIIHQAMEQKILHMIDPDAERNDLACEVSCYNGSFTMAILMISWL